MTDIMTTSGNNKTSGRITTSLYQYSFIKVFWSIGIMLYSFISIFSKPLLFFKNLGHGLISCFTFIFMPLALPLCLGVDKVSEKAFGFASEHGKSAIIISSIPYILGVFAYVLLYSYIIDDATNYNNYELINVYTIKLQRLIVLNSATFCLITSVVLYLLLAIRIPHFFNVTNSNQIAKLAAIEFYKNCTQYILLFISIIFIVNYVDDAINYTYSALYNLFSIHLQIKNEIIMLFSKELYAIVFYIWLFGCYCTTLRSIVDFTLSQSAQESKKNLLRNN